MPRLFDDCCLRKRNILFIVTVIVDLADSELQPPSTVCECARLPLVSCCMTASSNIGHIGATWP